MPAISRRPSRPARQDFPESDWHSGAGTPALAREDRVPACRGAARAAFREAVFDRSSCRRHVPVPRRAMGKGAWGSGDPRGTSVAGFDIPPAGGVSYNV